ncbi:MAG: flagellar basal body P-ring formation chaperone FlgA [Janthinobacterium lividum]
MKLALVLTCMALPVVVAPARAAPVATVTLKPYTALAHAVVRLSDLFDGADDRPIGPGPLPGARITVEAPQLAAIARMFGVDWRPAGSERAVLERPGKSLAKEDVLSALRAVLLAEGAPRDSEIELPGFTTPPLPASAAPSFDFSSTSYDSGSGRFSTMLLATVDGMAPIQLRLSGRVQEMVALPVPRRAMMPGEVMTAADLQWTRLRVGVARGELVRQPAQAEGQAVRRPLQQGQPVQLADLGRPMIVSKGMPLVLELNEPGLQVIAQGVATEAGGLGERIHVTNPYSRSVIEAEILGAGRARVVPARGNQVAAR